MYEIHTKSLRKESPLTGELIDRRGIILRNFDIKPHEITRLETFGLPEDLYIFTDRDQSGYRLFSQKLIVQKQSIYSQTLVQL
ncbi:hypothetical protein [Dyadobacter psychrophilus]|uniref:Uncharacterized protein n=1 Tax=Dyadobacter psychrophilus TaxID=651661 RepID=A0A1T5BHJ9_9BACT|nr:hypothetical protein [Dyadobacter psychrophilus]SKB46480.1 hypothetical protein SAMN05660293_00334 [Dyadobacter psychrophilus]